MNRRDFLGLGVCAVAFGGCRAGACRAGGGGVPFSLEYEANFEDNVPDVAACVGYYNALTRCL